MKKIKQFTYDIQIYQKKIKFKLYIQTYSHINWENQILNW